MSELKDRLKEARRDAKLSQARLAQLDGLKNQSIIGSIESGHRKTTTYIDMKLLLQTNLAICLIDGLVKLSCWPAIE